MGDMLQAFLLGPGASIFCDGLRIVKSAQAVQRKTPGSAGTLS